MTRQPLPETKQPTRFPRLTRVDEPRRRAAHNRRVMAVMVGVALGGALMPGGMASADAAAERNLSSTEPHRVEAIDLGCEGAQIDDVAAVRCRWTVPTSVEVAGVRVIRVAVGSELGRTTVFRTDDVSENGFVDQPLRAGVRYVYAVRAVDVNGRLVAASRPVSSGVRIEPPVAVEVLRLDCAQISGIRVSCDWSDPVVNGRVLTLWRSVDAGVREQVASFSEPFPTAYVDGVPTGSTSVAYAVVVANGDGDVVARSRPDGVRLRMPDTESEPVDAERTETVRPEQVQRDSQPVEPRPVETRPVETRPVETVPVETRPVETRPVDTRPVDTRPVDTRPVETRPVETRPLETRPVETRPVETRPIGTLESVPNERSED